MLPDEAGMLSAFTIAHVTGITVAMLVAASADMLGLSILLGRSRGPRQHHFAWLHAVILTALLLILASGGGLISLRVPAWCAQTDNPLILHFGPLCLPSKLVAKLILVTVLVCVAFLIESQLMPISRRPERPLLLHLTSFEIAKVALIGSASLTCWSSLLAIPLVKPLHSWPLGDLLLAALALWGVLSATLSMALVVARDAMRRRGAAPIQLAASQRIRLAASRGDLGFNVHHLRPVPDMKPLPHPGKRASSRGPRPAKPAIAVPRSDAATLEAAVAACRPALLATFAMSALINILMLSGPLFMLQVYDRVMTSRSLQTLVLLTALLIGLYLVLGVLDAMRGRILLRISIRLDRLLSDVLLTSAMRVAPANAKATAGHPMADLEQIRQFVAGPAPPAMLDLPWTPFYFALLYLLHVDLGLVATAGAVVLIVLSLSNQMLTRRALARSAEQNQKSSAILESGRRSAEAVQAMGMVSAHRGRWLTAHRRALSEQLLAGDIASRVTAATRVSRMALQSLMLAMGAYLAINGAVSAGAMIASSIIATRALAPIELLAMQWRAIESVRAAIRRCRALLLAEAPRPQPIELPEPSGDLEVRNLYVMPLGGTEPVLRGVTFSLSPGDALAVAGPSASGKSSLARALVGVWPIRHGDIRLDSASLAQWPAAQLGRLVGYLPQDVSLFDGTIAENIARLEPEPQPRLVIAAAKSAGVHEMILSLPDGYAARVGEGGRLLSGGQRQRIALARALYGEPAFIVMDEPNASLDTEGEAALVRAIKQLRQNGRIVVVMAHRNSVLAAVNRMLLLKDGQQVAFGHTKNVLEFIRNRNTKVRDDASPRFAERVH